MKVFKDLEFKELGGGRIGAFERFSNDFHFFGYHKSGIKSKSKMSNNT